MCTMHVGISFLCVYLSIGFFFFVGGSGGEGGEGGVRILCIPMYVCTYAYMRARLDL